MSKKIEEIKNNNTYYLTECSKTYKLMQLQNFSDDLDNLLKSEEYSMKKQFKY